MDTFDALAVILGVWLTLRKLDANSHDPAKHAEIRKEDFERWQRAAARAYAIGSYGSFFREVFHFGFIWYLKHHAMSPIYYPRIGFSVDVLWWASLAACFYLARQARQLRDSARAAGSGAL
ncbi:MAG TPA: hypothetical protein VGI10_08205 [Polyangiaceae bacterium]